MCKDEAEEKECRDKAVRSLQGDRDSVTPSRGHTDQKGAVQSHLCAALCASPTHGKEKAAVALRLRAQSGSAGQAACLGPHCHRDTATARLSTGCNPKLNTSLSRKKRAAMNTIQMAILYVKSEMKQMPSKHRNHSISTLFPVSILVRN